MNASGWVWPLMGLALLTWTACDQSNTGGAANPGASSKAAATPSGSAVPSGSASPSGGSPSASPSARGSDDCAALRAAVVKEAGKVASSPACSSNADCKIHDTRLCDFDELDCYATHVHQASDTKTFDDAVSAFAKSCTMRRCKCEKPEASVCKSGTCTGE